MPPDARVLAFDTSAAHCAAALLSGRASLAERSEDMGRGQAERLMPLLEGMLAATGLTWRDLDAVAVGTGPGNFTGIRISVATARGLAMSLGIPAVGVTGFAALAEAPAGPLLVTLPAPRDQAYAELWRDGAPQGPAMLIDPAAPPDALRAAGAVQVRGHRADEIARHLGGTALPPVPGNPALRIGQVAAMRLTSGHPHDALPAPVYVRPADAAPAREAPPVILP